MDTISLIRAISDDEAKDFSKVLAWLNPIPEDAEGLLERLDAATNRLEYMAGRQGNNEDEIENSLQSEATVERVKQIVKKAINDQAI